MSRTSILDRSTRAAAALAIIAALLSPASAADRQATAAVYPEMSSSAAMDRAPVVLTSRLPWPAPVGHRQPRRDEVPQSEISAWERQQRQLDQELNRKLIICRGC